MQQHALMTLHAAKQVMQSVCLCWLNITLACSLGFTGMHSMGMHKLHSST